MKKLRAVIDRLIEKQLDLPEFLVGFLSVLAIRVFIEEFLAKTNGVTVSEVIIEYLHNLNFFSLALIPIWLLLSYLLKTNPRKLSFLILSASTLIIFPPLLDMLRTGGEVYWSFYLISSAPALGGQFLSVFGNLPSGIMYFGTKIIFITAILLVAIIIFLRTNSWPKSITGAFGTYIILFIMGSFPTLFSFAYYAWLGKNVLDIQAFEVIQLFARPEHIWGVYFTNLSFVFPYKLNILYYPILISLLMVLFAVMDRKKILAVLGNFRYPQIIYHSGLFLLGMGLGYLDFSAEYEITLRPDNSMLVFSSAATLSLLISIWLAWKASVVVNDLADYSIDVISNPNRPLPLGIFTRQEYGQFGGLCFLLSLMGSVTVGFKFLVLILIYQIIAWFYSAPVFRLKRFPVLATFVSALASLMVLFMGYALMSPDQTIEHLSSRIIFLLLFAYTLSIPIKDFKDIAGDKKDGVRTIPVLFGETKGRLIVATSMFLSFMLSVFFLNEFRLFFWAMFFGVITFFVVNSSKINPRRLPWWVLGIVFAYGIILVKIVFLG